MKRIGRAHTEGNSLDFIFVPEPGHKSELLYRGKFGNLGDSRGSQDAVSQFQVIDLNGAVQGKVLCQIDDGVQGREASSAT